METKIFSRNELDSAAQIIKNGGLVAMPTETVYGLGADAFNEKAVKKIYKAKGRESDNPLIVHVAGFGDWRELVKNIPEDAKKLAEKYWPGPLTIILPKSKKVPSVVSGGLDTVAVRMPRNEIALYFIQKCGCPIAAPSANISGSPSPTKFNHVFKDMNGKIDAIIDGGDCRIGVESTVIAFAGEKPEILRPGGITKEQIEDVIGNVNIHNAVLHNLKQGETASSPGMKYKHYAPNAEIIILDGNDRQFAEYIEENAMPDSVALCFNEQENLISVPTITIGSRENSEMQASLLFDALRKIDESGAKTAFAPMPKAMGIGLAVVNRLLRAAAFRVIDLNEWETRRDEQRELKAKKLPNFREEQQEKPIKRKKDIEEVNFDFHFAEDDKEYEIPEEKSYIRKIPGIHVIGITGKTGSGKSSVAKSMIQQNPSALLIDADEICHRILEKDEVAVSLVYEFGKDILSNRSVNRRKLARLVFSDKSKLDKLNKITHPLIAEDIIHTIEKAAADGVKTVILDAPTLIESGLNGICDEVIFVKADKQIRTTRIIARDELSVEEARQRMNFEHSDDYYIEFASKIINNN